jgi:hypothetical protein
MIPSILPTVVVDYVAEQSGLWPCRLDDEGEGTPSPPSVGQRRRRAPRLGLPRGSPMCRCRLRVTGPAVRSDEGEADERGVVLPVRDAGHDGAVAGQELDRVATRSMPVVSRVQVPDVPPVGAAGYAVGGEGIATAPLAGPAGSKESPKLPKCSSVTL